MQKKISKKTQRQHACFAIAEGIDSIACTSTMHPKGQGWLGMIYRAEMRTLRWLFLAEGLDLYKRR